MDIQSLTEEQFFNRLDSNVSRVYEESESKEITNSFINVFAGLQPSKTPQLFNDSALHWDEREVFLITYGNSIYSDVANPLQVLYGFLMKYARGAISTIHVLPFFPYSLDDGVAVINYQKVKKDLGDWNDIKKIAGQFKLMSDLVINHISSKSDWSQQYKGDIN